MFESDFKRYVCSSFGDQNKTELQLGSKDAKKNDETETRASNEKTNKARTINRRNPNNASVAIPTNINIKKENKMNYEHTLNHGC